MTANQLVAYNLKRARELRGWKQDEAARKLEPYLGRVWSKATFSAAETSTTSGRTREFSADEILAFARAFDVPVGWFFLPPAEEGLRGPVSTGGPNVADLPELLDRITPADIGAVRERLDELEETAPDELRGYKGRVAAAADLVIQNRVAPLIRELTAALAAQQEQQEPLTLADVFRMYQPKEGDDG